LFELDEFELLELGELELLELDVPHEVRIIAKHKIVN
jgi:hypothetical protein